MSNVSPIPNRPEPNSAGYSTSTSRQIAAGIENLFDALPVEDQHTLLDRLTAKIRVIPASRAGDALGIVVKFISKKELWSAREIRDEVAANGVEASPKSVFNAIEYLHRRGQLEKLGGGMYRFRSGVGYGEHRDDGSAVASAYDLGGGTVRPSEHY
jgi:hypothetical protein